MAAVTLLGSATFTTASGSKAVTATPAVGDLIVIITAHTGNTSAAKPTDNNDAGTYTEITACASVKASSADQMRVFIRDSRIQKANSTVFTHNPGASSGGGLTVLKVTGMTRAGLTAARQGAKQDNQAAATPAPVFGSAALTGNACIGAVFNATSPATMTQRASWTERNDVGYSTPTTGLETMSRDSGETGTTQTWGSASASAFCSTVLELNTSVPTTVGDDSDGYVGSQASFAGTAVAKAAAALVLASTLCMGIQQQTEDICTVTVTPEPAEAFSWGPKRAVQYTNIKRWEYTDELPTAPVIALEDGSDWVPPSPERPPAKWLRWGMDDEGVPYLSVDEDYEVIRLPKAAPIASQALSADDEVARIAEETEWQIYPTVKPLPALYLPPQDDDVPISSAQSPPAGAAAKRDPIRLYLWASEDSLPITPPFGGDETEWQVYQPPAIAKQPLYLPDANDTLPAKFVAEDDWSQPPPQPVAKQPLYLPDNDDTLPARFVAEDDWATPVPAIEAKRALYLPDPGDDVSPQVSVTLDEDGFTPKAVTAPVQLSLFAGGEDEVPVVVPFADDAWAQPFIAQPGPRFSAFLADDELVQLPQAMAGTPSARTPIRLQLWAQDDGLPQPAIPLNIEEEDWKVWTPPLVPKLGLYLPDQSGDERTTVPPPLAAEETEWPFVPTLGPRARFQAFLADDEWEITPTFTPSDDYWYQNEAPGNQIVIVHWPGVGAGLKLPDPVAPALDEPWVVYTPKAAPPRFLYLPDGENSPATPTPLNIEEEDWKVWTPPLVGKQGLHLPDPEQVPAGALGAIEEEDWKVYTPPLLGKQPLYLPDPEEVPAGGFRTIEEEDWRVVNAPLVGKQPLYLPDPEELPAGSLTPAPYEDDSWGVYTALPPGPRFVYLPDPEEIPAGGFRTIEEEDWRVATPPYPGKQPLYLPDPEEIPAGLIVPPLVVEDDSWLVYTSLPPAPTFVYLPDPEEFPVLVEPPPPPPPSGGGHSGFGIGGGPGGGGHHGDRPKKKKGYQPKNRAEAERLALASGRRVQQSVGWADAWGSIPTARSAAQEVAQETPARPVSLAIRRLFSPLPLTPVTALEQPQAALEGLRKAANEAVVKAIAAAQAKALADKLAQQPNSPEELKALAQSFSQKIESIQAELAQQIEARAQYERENQAAAAAKAAEEAARVAAEEAEEAQFILQLWQEFFNT